MTVLETRPIGQPSPSQVSGVAQIARLLYLLSTLAFTVAVLVQVFFAGAALLVSSEYLTQHRIFAHVMELLVLTIPILSLFARLPRRLVLLNWLPVILFGLQYVFLYALPSMGIPVTWRALHAVNALIIFLNTVYLAVAALRLIRSQNHAV
jgi:hypothetical protein